jgi:hypothetical protein
MFANVGPFVDPELAADHGQIVEDCGFESIWTVEHTVIPRGYESRYPYDRSGKMPAGNCSSVSVSDGSERSSTRSALRSTTAAGGWTSTSRRCGPSRVMLPRAITESSSTSPTATANRLRSSPRGHPSSSAHTRPPPRSAPDAVPLLGFDRESMRLGYADFAEKVIAKF